jgi:mannosyltransferase
MINQSHCRLTFVKLLTSILPKHDRLDDLRCTASLLTIIIFIGLVLRSYCLTSRSLWFDEAFSWRIIQFPFLEMIQRVGRDNHPPLYFVLLQGWTAVFGESALALRALSVLLGSLTILGVFVFAVEAFGRDLVRSDTNAELRMRGRGIGVGLLPKKWSRCYESL